MTPGHIGGSEIEGVWVVALHGEHDVSTCEELRSRLEGLGAREGVVIDLTETEFIDSTIVSVLMEAAHEHPELSVVVPAHGAVARLAGVCGLRISGTEDRR